MARRSPTAFPAAAPPNGVAKAGSPSDFKVGDKVNVIGFPRRDNGLEVAIKTFTRVSDGKSFGAPLVQKY